MLETILAAPFIVMRFGAATLLPTVYPEATSPVVTTDTGTDTDFSSSSSTDSTLSTTVMLTFLAMLVLFAVTVIGTAFVMDIFDISATALKSDASRSLISDLRPLTTISTVSPEVIVYN